MILCVFSEFRTECVAKIANPAEKTVRFQNKKSGIFTIRGVSGITLKVVNFLTQTCGNHGVAKPIYP
jgi:hypothetical protein